MADNGKIVYISVNFGHKKSDRNENISLEGWKMDIGNIQDHLRTVAFGLESIRYLVSKIWKVAPDK